MIRAISRHIPLRSPSIPAPFPAALMSWHGNPPDTTSTIPRHGLPSKVSLCPINGSRFHGFSVRRIPLAVVRLHVLSLVRLDRLRCVPLALACVFAGEAHAAAASVSLGRLGLVACAAGFHSPASFAAASAFFTYS